MNCPFCDKAARLHDPPADKLVAQFTHSIAILAPWQFFTGYCILISRVHATELFELPDDTRRGLFDEMTLLARALHAEFRPRKLNYELLGNQVPHIHWHLIPRYDSDPDHLKPAWIAMDRAERDPEWRSQLHGPSDRKTIIDRLRKSLAQQTI